MSLAKKAGKAGALLFFRKVWGGLVNLGVMAYLARTLDKEDFGLVAISGVLISFISVFALSGIGEYVVFYQEKDESEIANAAFWLNLVLTLGVATAALIAAPFWASSYGDLRIIRLVWLLLVGFVFTALSSLPNAIFRKHLNYAPMVKVQTIFGTLSQLSQVLFAALGFGVYSLALPNALITPAMAIALFWVSGFRPKASLGRRHWGKIFSYTKNVIGARVLNKFANEGDTLLIGKLLGMQALGIYDLAFKLANLINVQLVPILTNIAMPVFAKTKNDVGQVKNHFMNMTRLLALMFIPLYGALILFAPDIVRLLYGEKWADAIIPLQILSVFAVVRALSSPASGLYNALGKPHIGFYFTLCFVPVFLVTIYLSSTLGGLIMACITVTLLRNAGSVFHFFMASKLLNIFRKDWTVVVLPAFMSTLLAMVIALIFKMYTPPSILTVFLYSITLGMGFYLFFKQHVIWIYDNLSKLVRR